MAARGWTEHIATSAALAGALVWGRRPRRGVLRDGAGAGRWQHEDWNALLRRFVHNGEVDYHTFSRVRRILEIYLDRVADARPDTWVDADEQVAFYLNAYNAIAVHLVIARISVASLRDVPAAFARPYPVGQRNVSLGELQHSILRAYGDPRVHLALAPAARGGPSLQSWAFSGRELQAQLETITQQFLADEQRGARYDAATHTLFLSPILRRWAGDWIDPTRMPSPTPLLHGWLQPTAMLPKLLPYLPPTLQTTLRAAPQPPRLQWITYDWRLNGPVVSERLGRAW